MINLKEFDKRVRALEEKGLEITVIGHKPHSPKVYKERAFQRFVRHLVFGDSGRGIGITVSGLPQVKGTRITVGLALDIPLGKRQLRLSREDKKLLERLLVEALEEAARERSGGFSSRASKSAPRPTPRRASTGS
jgi:hypothetical protein